MLKATHKRPKPQKAIYVAVREKSLAITLMLHLARRLRLRDASRLNYPWLNANISSAPANSYGRPQQHTSTLATDKSHEPRIQIIAASQSNLDDVFRRNDAACRTRNSQLLVARFARLRPAERELRGDTIQRGQSSCRRLPSDLRLADRIPKINNAEGGY